MLVVAEMRRDRRTEMWTWTGGEQGYHSLGRHCARECSHGVACGKDGDQERWRLVEETQVGRTAEIWDSSREIEDLRALYKIQ